MSCKNKNGYPIKPAPFAPSDPGCCPPPRPPRPCPPQPCPPSQYVGSRYVPIFADPIEWDINKSYESLTIVTYNGESYTSRCNVAPGIDITNSRYWAKTGAYNAQVEQMKESVKDLSSQVTGFAEDNKEFRDKMEQFEKDNAEMKNTVAKNDGRVDDLAKRVAQNETDIDSLQATANEHTKELADLHAKDEDLQRQISSNDADIAALQAKDTEQDARLDGIDTKLKSHDATLAQHTEDIARNTKNIQDNAANIAINAAELAKHAEQLKDHDAQLTVLHKETTENHQAIERLTGITDGLRADLTEDEAKIAQNADAIAHIQEKDVQQDGRLDKLETCCNEAKEHFTQLDEKTDATNTALAEEIDRAKAAELANAKNIAKNAAELANHATELADHDERISSLESDNTVNKKDIADIKAKNASQDSAISENSDDIAHIKEKDTAQDTSIKKNTDDITAIKAKDTAQDTKISALETKTAEIENTLAGDYVTKNTYNAGQAAQDTKITAAQDTADEANGKATANETTIGNWSTTYPDAGDTITAKVTEVENLAEGADARSNQNTTNITKNTQDITNLNDGLSALGSRVSDIESTLASYLVTPSASIHGQLRAKYAPSNGRHVFNVHVPFPIMLLPKNKTIQVTKTADTQFTLISAGYTGTDIPARYMLCMSDNLSVSVSAYSFDELVLSVVIPDPTNEIYVSGSSFDTIKTEDIANLTALKFSVS